MAGLHHVTKFAVPTSFDWGVLTEAESFLVTQCGGRDSLRSSRWTHLSGPGFSYHEDETLPVALEKLGARRADVTMYSLADRRADGLTVELTVYPEFKPANELKVSGTDQVAVNGIAQTFREQFLVETDTDLKWRKPEPEPHAATPVGTPPVVAIPTGPEPKFSWQYISTHPLYSAIIAALVAGAILALLVWVV